MTRISYFHHLDNTSVTRKSEAYFESISVRKQPKLVKFKGESFHAVIIRFVTDRRKKKKKKREERLMVESREKVDSSNPPVKSKIDRIGAHISLPACDFQSPRMSVHQPPHNLFFSR